MNTKNKAMNIRDEWSRSVIALKEAQVLAGERLLEGATSRAYYAAFHAAQAVLLTRGLQPKSHYGVMYLFNHHFVRKGDIEPEYSQILARAAKYREEADYRHTMVFSMGHVEQAIEEVGLFLKRMKKYLAKKGFPPSP